MMIILNDEVDLFCEYQGLNKHKWFFPALKELITSSFAVQKTIMLFDNVIELIVHLW